MKEPRSSHNLVVQLHESFFAERIKIDLAQGLPFNRMLLFYFYRKPAFRNKD
jgi:hypothetical protein